MSSAFLQKRYFVMGILLTDNVWRLSQRSDDAQQLTCIGLLISRPLPMCSEQVQRASINGAVPASFVAPPVISKSMFIIHPESL